MSDDPKLPRQNGPRKVSAAAQAEFYRRGAIDAARYAEVLQDTHALSPFSKDDQKRIKQAAKKAGVSSAQFIMNAVIAALDAKRK
jgi:hypothetical protein